MPSSGKYSKALSLGLNEREVNNLISLYGGYRAVAAFIDLTTQIPTGDTTDALTPVLFGAGGLSADGVISVDANGVFTNLKAGYWFLKARARAKREGANQTSELFVQFYKRVSSAGSWLPFGESIDVELDNSKQTEIVLDESFFMVMRVINFTWAGLDLVREPIQENWFLVFRPLLCLLWEFKIHRQHRLLFLHLLITITISRNNKFKGLLWKYLNLGLRCQQSEFIA